MKKLGIIAAKGDLSKKLITYSKAKFELFIVALIGETDPLIIEDLPHIWIHIGEIGKAINAMKEAQIEQIIFVGALKKPDLLSLKVDGMGTKLLAKITKDQLFGDNNILTSITKFLESQAFKVIGVHEVLQDLVVKAGNFTVLAPNQQDQADIDLARQVVQALGILDVGQAAIVQNGIVLGVEAIEGTDALIQRCGELKRASNYGGVLLKATKPNQELRIDLPTIGLTTIINIYTAGFKGIAIEAERTIFLDQKEVIDFANAHQMFIYAYTQKTDSSS